MLSPEEIQRHLDYITHANEVRNILRSSYADGVYMGMLHGDPVNDIDMLLTIIHQLRRELGQVDYKGGSNPLVKE